MAAACGRRGLFYELGAALGVGAVVLLYEQVVGAVAEEVAAVGACVLLLKLQCHPVALLRALVSEEQIHAHEEYHQTGEEHEHEYVGELIEARQKPRYTAAHGEHRGEVAGVVDALRALGDGEQVVVVLIVHLLERPYVHLLHGLRHHLGGGIEHGGERYLESEHAELYRAAGAGAFGQHLHAVDVGAVVGLVVGAVFG